ncbi:APC family permease [Corynebacterium marquesiae]|uniref:APC family permease n=1 Tax=Corynebacterium marquesiae TaxID=2913503 RepID=UPI0022BA56E8|nr:APC family permease [Corynebacterium marquesiae]MCZ9300452.1 APC family permease [Corynebacterium marquesiae]
MTTSAMNSPPTGRRALSTWEVTAISVGFMGPVMAMSLNGIGVAGLVGKSVPFAFAVAFAGTLFVAYAFVRLLQRVTHAGSVYALAGITIGPKSGFFSGFALLGTYIFMTTCILGACSVFFEAMLQELGAQNPSGTWLFIPIFVSAVGLYLNLRNSSAAARVTLAIGLAGVAAMVALSVAILFKVTAGTSTASSTLDFQTLTPAGNSWSAIMTASVFAFLSWAGFESGSSLGEETANPKRTVPRSLLLAVIIGGCLYVFVMFAQVNGFGTDERGITAFAESSSTLTHLGSMYIGQWFSVLISVIAFAVAFGAFLSSSTATSRLLHTLARDGFGPSAFAERDSKTLIPKSAVWATNLIGLIFALALGVAGRSSVEIYYWYATIATLCMVVAYAMASVGAIRFIMKKDSSIPRWETIFPLLALGYLVYVYFIQVVGQEAPYSHFPWISGIWCLLGLIIVLANPNLANQIGQKLTKEDIQ